MGQVREHPGASRPEATDCGKRLFKRRQILVGLTETITNYIAVLYIAVLYIAKLRAECSRS